MLLVAIAALAQQWPSPTPSAKAGARWWWLGSAVTAKGLAENMQEYSRAGIGALEITPIYGVQGNKANELQFLSTPWMEALRTTQAEGKKNGIIIDMNTGTGWPFGGPTIDIDHAAAKLVVVDTVVTGKGLREGIDIAVKNPKETKYARLQRVVAYDTEGAATDLTASTADGKAVWKKAGKKATYRIVAAYCSRTRQMVKRAAPGGEGYVMDHFDAEAVEGYFAHFDRAFAKSGVPYPHAFFNDSYEVYGANWTPRLFEEFQARRGYKLEDHLPELLGDTPCKDERVLSDYRETLSDLLLENFTRRWTAWAHGHGAITRNQAHGSPADLIDTYAAVDIPEIEGFGLSEFGIRGLRRDSGFTRKNDSDVSMLKYASSAAHITGRTLASSETFTWLTEHFRTSLSQCKPDLDLMFSCGVNNVYFHGICYSPKEEAWPGWHFYASVDMSPTNSIWRDAPSFMSYIERCQSFLQMGRPDNDFLVLVPVRDMWAQRKGKGPGSLLMQFDIHGMKNKAPEFIKSILDIDRAGFDCDYTSERQLMATDYVDGMLQTSGGARYRGLIIPGSGRMSAKAKAHIEALKAKGAHIIYGIDDAAMLRIAKPEQLRRVCGLRLLRRANDTGHHYFMANLTPKDICQRVPLAVECRDARWFDPMTGKVYAADINAGGLQVDMRSGESLILQTYDKPLATAAAKRATTYTAEKSVEGPWTLSFQEAEPLPHKTYKLPKADTWEALDDTCAVLMGTGIYTTTIVLTKAEAAKQWTIDLGDVRESARVYVNGQYAGCAWAVPFTLDLGNMLKAGKNTLRIEVTNLPANRIAKLDRDGVKWRKFNEINIVDINYKKTTYASWKPVDSGLASEVKLLGR